MRAFLIGVFGVVTYIITIFGLSCTDQVGYVLRARVGIFWVMVLVVGFIKNEIIIWKNADDAIRITLFGSALGVAAAVLTYFAM